MPASPNVTFRAAEGLDRQIQARAGGAYPLGAVAKRDLERFYHTLSVELATVDLTEAEALLVLEAENGTMHEPWSVPLLWAGVADAIRLDGLDRKWDLDGPALVGKLQGLTYAQTLAIVDATEHAWHLVRGGDPRPMDEIAREVGLVREPARSG